MKKANMSYISIVLILSMLLTMSFGLTALSVSAAGETQPLTFQPNYYGKPQGSVPTGWSGDKIAMGTWGEFAFSSWGPSDTGTMLYNDAIWTGALEYTWLQWSVFGGTAYLYFDYTDSNNYYAVSISSSPKLIKRVNGVETVLATSTTAYTYGDIMNFKLVRDAAGAMTVSCLKKDTTVPVVWFEGITDTSLNTGKIGMGFKASGGYFGAVKVVGTQLIASSPSPSPTASATTSGTPSPTSTTEALTYNPNLIGKFVGSLPTGWSGQKYALGTWGNFEYSDYAPAATGYAIYDDVIWTGALEYSFTQINVYGGTGYLYFCYTDSNNYYAVSIGSNTKLIKKVGGVETVIATNDAGYTGIEQSIKIVRSSDGKISVNSAPKNATTPVTVWFDNVQDTTFNTGKIGMGFKAGGGYFAAIKVVGNKLVTIIPTPCPSTTTSSTPSPTSTTEALTYNPNLVGKFVGALPTGWSGDKIALGTWGDFKFAAWNPSDTGSAIYDDVIWTGALEYSFTQINVYGGTGYLYFCYTDSNNYYAVLMGSNTKLIKKVNGVESVLATNDTSYIGIEQSIKIVRSSDGKISVNSAPKGATTPVTVWFENISDTSLNTGKIGMGFTASGGYFAAIKAVGTKLITILPSVAPSPTPTPETIMYKTTYSENFDSISDVEKAKWVNASTTYPMSVVSSHLGGNDWGATSINTYTGKTLSGNYKVGADIYQNTGGNLGNSGGIVFNYQSSFKGYSVDLQGTDSGSIILRKFTGDQWNGIETLATYADTTYLKRANVRIEVTYEVGGYISVDCIKAGVKTRIFDRIQDASYTSGQFGATKTSSQFYFDNYVVQEEMVPLSVSASAIDSTKARYLSRTWTSGDAAEMCYSLSGIEFMVENATKVDVEIKESGDPTSYYGVFIDDSLDYTTFTTTATAYAPVTIARFAEPGNHKIRIMKLCAFRTMLYIKTITAYGTDVLAPTILASPAKSRKIEFVGDSITTGQGASNIDGREEPWKAYSGQTAAYFGADVNVAAIGGGGFTATLDGLNTYFYYKHVYNWVPADQLLWDFTKFTPDITVINIGTNGGTANTPTHYIDFVNQVRAAHNDTNKNIPIILALGPMYNSAWPSLTAAVTQLNNSGDTKVYALNMGEFKISGGDDHPSTAEHAETAAILIAKMKEIMPQWDNGLLTANNVNVDLATETVKVDYNALLQTTTSVSYTIWGGIYDSNGRLVSVANQSISFNTDAVSVNKTLSISTKQLPKTGNYTIKLMMWCSMLQPKALTTQTASFTLN